MSRRARALVTAVLAVLTLVLTLVLTGCSGGSGGSDDAAPRPTPTTAAPAPTPGPAPVRGACHELTYDEAVAPTSAAAPATCARIHTAETFAVGELKTVRGGHLLAVDAASVQDQVATLCPRRLAGFVGEATDQADGVDATGDVRLSMLRAVWFTPTVAESDAGASWFRCDVIAVAREGVLAPVKGGLRHALGTAEGMDRYGMCGTDQPGSDDFERVICRAPHTWRAIQVVPLNTESRGPGAGGYPGEDQARAAGQDVCDDAARARAADTLDYQWGYEWPTAEQWAGGQTYGRCWAPD